MESYESKVPEDKTSMEKYLGSGAIKGVGPALATRIVKNFGEDTFRVIETEPERLADVRGISERLARKIALQFEEKRDMRQNMLFLQQYGISNLLAVKIINQYGQKASKVLTENPYQLAEDISGIGFKISDEIALHAGFEVQSEFRIKACITYCLQQASQNGHIYLPETLLIKTLSSMLNIPFDDIPLETYFTDMVLEQKIVRKEQEGIMVIYPAALYYMELNCARMLLDLNREYPLQDIESQQILADIEKEEKIILDEMQRQAILEAQKHGLLVITGGPGTGKIGRAHV